MSLRSLRSTGSDLGKASAAEGSRKVNSGSGEASESTKGFTRMVEEDDDVELEDVRETGNPAAAAAAVAARRGVVSGKAGMTHSYARRVQDGPGGFAEVDLENGGGNVGIRVQKSYDVIAGDKI